MRIQVLADELTASAWRLVGADACVPTEADARQMFADSLTGSDLLLMTPGVVAWLDPPVLAEAQIGTQPFVVIIPDVAASTSPPDLEREVRRALGVEV